MSGGEDGEGWHAPHPRRGLPERDEAVRTTEAAELLERALEYALGAARCVTPELLNRPTPCAGWDLGALMAHVDDSLAALHEGMTGGLITLAPQPRPAPRTGPVADRGPVPRTGPVADRTRAEPDDPAAAFRRRASALLGAWAGTDPDRRLITVADSPLTAAAVALTGAVEIAVHGWDITRATGQYGHEVPAALARELLPVSRHLVPWPEARHPLFAPEVTVPPGAPPGARLLAYLGRSPDAWPPH